MATSMQSARRRTQSLLRRHQVIWTRRPERLRTFLAEVAGTRKFETNGDGIDFYSQINCVKLNALSLCFCAHSADIAVTFPETNSFRQKICLASHGEITFDQIRIPVSPDQSCVIPPDMESTVAYFRGYRQLLLTIDAEVVYRKLESLIGAPVDRPLAVEFAASFRMPELRNLRRMLLFLVGELDSPNSRFSDLALAEFEQAIIVSFLSGHRHTYSSFFDHAPKDASPQQIRNAEAYIEANWDKALTVEAISDAIGVSVRSVFKSFKEARGYSPMEFLKELRLQHAQEMFWHSDPSTSVTGVAFQCGFNNLGHFARDYRLRFGELPSETLNRARKPARELLFDTHRPESLGPTL